MGARLRNGVRFVVRWRYLLLALVALGWSVYPYLRFTRFGALAGDYYSFVYGGRALIGAAMPGYHGSPLHLFHEFPGFQIGPPPLFLVGVLSLLPGNLGLAVWMALTMACGVISLRAIELVLLRAGVSEHRAGLTTLLGGVAVLGCWSALVSWFHLEDAIATMCILLSVAAIASRRPWWLVSLLVGAGAACKPWALIALPLLLALPQAHRWRAGAVAVATGAVWWLPFLIADPHTLSALAAFPNRISPHAAFRALGFKAYAPAPQHLRTLELLFAAAMAALAITRNRWVGAPLAAFAARLLLEPRWFVYYGAGLIAATFLWESASADRRVPIWTATAIAIEYPIQEWAPAHIGAILHLALLLALLAAVMIRTQPARLTPANESTGPATTTSGATGGDCTNVQV
jgi:hypothetical protein